MNHKAVWAILICMLGLGLAVSGAASAAPSRLTSGACPTDQGYVYQGKLNQAGIPAQGSYDFHFGFYSSLEGGSLIEDIYCPAISVESGLFTVGLSLKPESDISNLYLETRVGPAGSESNTILSPRQKVAPVPLAKYAGQIKAPLKLSGQASLENQTILTVIGSNAQYAITATSTNMPAILASSTGAYAAEFIGSIHVTGSVVTPGNPAIQVPHPLDPQGKTLNLAAPAADEMLAIRNGNITLDEKGEASVPISAWFEAGTTDFRYTLTPIGSAAPGLYVSREVSGGSFGIAGGVPGMKVSWQVTGVRTDAYAEAHPLTVEQTNSSAGQQP